MKRILILICTLLCWCCLGELARAEIRPSFCLESSIYEATDIILASEGKDIDGNMTVLKVLKGSLRVGDTISIPKLADFRSEKSRSVRPWFGWSDKGKEQKIVSGNKMVLFLTRTKAAKAGELVWLPADADYGTIRTSVAWLDEGGAYAFIQVINPGDSVLVKLDISEEEMLKTITGNLDTLRELHACEKMKDRAMRAKAISAYVESSHSLVPGEAVGMLGGCGAEGLPFLKKVLNDPGKPLLHCHAVRMIGRIGGGTAVSELTSLVKQELAYWKEMGPTLKSDWWNSRTLPAEERRDLRHRYGIVLEVFYTLRRSGAMSPTCKAAITEFRDYWRSQPSLENGGLSQMSEACDAILDLPSSSVAK